MNGRLPAVTAGQVLRALERATDLGINLANRAALRPRFAARIADDLIPVF